MQGCVLVGLTDKTNRERKKVEWRCPDLGRVQHCAHYIHFDGGDSSRVHNVLHSLRHQQICRGFRVIEERSLEGASMKDMFGYTLSPRWFISTVDLTTSTRHCRRRRVIKPQGDSLTEDRYYAVPYITTRWIEADPPCS